jgi:hypothetical protein
MDMAIFSGGKKEVVGHIIHHPINASTLYVIYLIY